MENVNDRPAIRVFWWQGGLHLEPQTDEQRQQLVSLLRVLGGVRVDHESHASPIGAVHALDEKPIVGVHELP
jgi:hypothetical protein